MDRRVLVVTGPTATGKTRLGIMLARKLGGEVVSADSMQIYRGMDIGTAKPTAQERSLAVHHMIDVADPWEDYSVARYVEEASACCDSLLEEGKTPVIVGGTGLYIESLLSGRDFAPRDHEGEARRRYSDMYDSLGGELMLERLRPLDPEKAEKLHPNDKKRIVRAFEVLEEGESLSDHDAATREKKPRYSAAVVVLNFKDRQELYRRIDLRVDQMMDQGLVGEVEGLLADGLSMENTAMQAIGYKEIAAALKGDGDIDRAVEEIKRGSRRYGKRQISWCKRYKDALNIEWDILPDFDEALRLSTDFWEQLV